MSNKHELQAGTALNYTGQPFDGFNGAAPQMTFLGYDSAGWNNIWVDYQGKTLFITLADVEVLK